MGALVGLLGGLGLFACWSACIGRPERTRRAGPAWRRNLAELLARAGLGAIAPGGFVAVSVLAFVAGWGVVAAATLSPVVAVFFGAMVGLAPWAIVHRRAVRRAGRLSCLWPDVVDHLASAVRAGMALPDAVAALASRGPHELRGVFASFAADYRAGGNLDRSFDRLADGLADPVGDRIVETLRLTREVGGTELGVLLRTLAQFLREDVAARAELEARQSSTRAGARMAAAAPWVVLGLLATRPEAVAAYDSVAGVAVLATGAAASVAAYWLMTRIGRLPQERRVVR